VSTFSVIIPTLNEERHVGALLAERRPSRSGQSLVAQTASVVRSVKPLRMVLACCLASSARLSKRAAALLDGLQAGGPVA
jgi:hypothetical protein